MFEFAEEALNPVALAVERIANAGFPFAIGSGRNFGRRALSLDQIADVASVISFLVRHYGARFETVQQTKRARMEVLLNIWMSPS